MSGAGLEGIAVVGMSGRFPGAAGVNELWRNLRSGVESITGFAAGELAEAGIPAGLLADPRYVRAAGILDGADRFDASFFGFTPREAELLDPQHRLFLEHAWQALEDAGIDPGRPPGRIGVFAGAGPPAYLLEHVYPGQRADGASLTDVYQALLANDKDFLATRVSYKLDLRGPSLTVQTACSTSLVAVCLACQSLMSGDCDAALAGGVSLRLPLKGGYLYQEGGILSPDGHCRAFDAEAQGTVPGSGVGVVVLRRLADALADGHRVRAVVRGWALNNDGGRKAGYTAPRAEGQAEAVLEALALAGVPAETVGYVEAHGTGTPLGDPVELAGLQQAFAAGGRPGPGSCALGSIKSNLGHLDAAAGVAGLIKTVLALEHGEIPPTLHCARPNPGLALEGSPFRIAASLAPWPAGPHPRRAGVSSFGIGGTNAHLVLEQAPEPAPRPADPGPPYLLLLSARTGPALEEAAAELARHLPERPGLDPADVAYTLQIGRRPFEHRRALLVRDLADAAAVLAAADPRRVRTAVWDGGHRPVAFLLPGQGAQHAGMGAGLYQRHAAFRRELDCAAEALRPHLGGADLRRVLFDGGAEVGQTALAQPALLVVELALAALWRELGVAPEALLGHSVGELTAACLAGVFTPEEALALVVARGRLMQDLPPGAMLSVPLAEADLVPLLEEDLALAAVNGPALCAVAGPPEGVERLACRLARDGVETRRLHTSHPFHSPAVEPLLEPFRDLVAEVALRPPRIPMLSTVTGSWLTAEEATDPAYWARQMRAPVRFAQAAAELLADGAGPGHALLEVGPGESMAGLLRLQPAGRGRAVASSLPHPQDPTPEAETFLGAAARLWLAGVAVEWQALHRGAGRRRVSLPTYPFQRERHWLEARRTGQGGTTAPRKGQDPAAGQPRLEVASAAPVPPDQAPRSAMEARLAAVWQEVLGVERIGPDDDFFQLGGNSLTGLQVLSRLRAELAVELPLKTLFEVRTVAAMAAEIEREQGQGVREGSAAIPRRDPADPGPFPLTFGQQRLWFVDQMNPGSPAYNLPFAGRLRGPLDAALLGASLREIARRHEILRTRFVEMDGRPMQVIDPRPVLALPVVDLSALPSRPREEEAARRVREEPLAPFDLARGPLIRAALVRLGPAEHDLLVTIHHIAVDAWSIAVFFRELPAIYDAWREGRPSPLPELPLQVADYALWERARLQGERLERELAFWRAHLDGAPTVLELATDLPRPPAQTLRGRHCSFVVPAALERDLAAVAGRCGATPFMAGLAAWAVVLHRWSDRDDLLVGSPDAARPEPATHGLIGYFATVAVLRVVLAGDPTFAELLARVKESALATFAHQGLPFDRLVDALGVEREPSRAALVQVSFVLQNVPIPRPRFADLSLVSMRQADTFAARFELSLGLAAEEGAEGLRGTLEYATDLFTAPTIARLGEHFLRLATAALAAPGRRLSELPLLAPAERHQILAEWSGRAAHGAADACLHDLFFRQAARRPEAVAVVGPAEERVTYGELAARAGRLAGRLRGLGVGPEVRVGICLERSVEALVAILGALGAGGAYVPLDPDLPPERLRLLLEDAAPAVLLAREPLTERLPALPGCRLVLLDGADAAPVAAAAEAAELGRAAPDNAAYVIYTSGSTGRPKGVVVPHRGVVNALCQARQACGVRPGSRLSQSASLTFDASVYQIFVALLSGASLHLIAREAVLAGMGHVEALRRHCLEIASMHPAVLQAVPETDLPDLRVLVTGAERCTAATAARWSAGRRLLNLYGPAEASIFATLFEGAGERPLGPPIGRPIPGDEVYLLDRQGLPVPIGVPAEICLGGVGLARGYLGEPGLTAERFAPHPFATRPGERLYRTGDVARWLPDGALEFVGRSDEQVKVRGNRVELGEVEAALRLHPGVAECAVVARRAASGSAQLAAWFVPRAGGPVAEAGELARSLAAALPRYMVPATFSPLESLPRNANRKVDRQALAGLELRPPAGGDAQETPATPVERTLARIWQEVLEVARVGRHESFFALGGDSIQGMRVIARAAEAGLYFEPRQLFEHPTIAALAAVAAPVPGAAAEQP